MTSPISMVKKNDDEYRPCVDARYINQHMIEVECRLPSKYEIKCLWSMSEDETVGKADLCNAFKSFKVMEDKQWISGINTHLGDYISPRLQFGYKSSSAIYANKLRQLLIEFELDKNLVINYIDDLAFVGKKENQVRSWVKFIQLCSKYNLPINLEKCQFQMKSMDFLGQTFSRFGMSIENKKLMELQNLKVPRSVSELQTSIGKLQCCRAYIRDIAMLIKRIVSKRNVLPERELLEETWKEIQSNLKETRTLYIPEKKDILIFEVADFDLHPEIVDTKVYVMKDVKKIVQVIERTLSSSKRNYNKCELELLALENAIKHYHGYGHELSIITKSTAIEWILLDDILNQNDISRRVMKFAVPIILSGVKIKIVNDDTKIKLSKIRYLETNNLPSYMSAYEHDELLEDQKNNSLINMIVESWTDQTGTCMKKLPALLRNGTDLTETQEGIFVFDNKPIVSKEYLKRKA
uniref:Reverse transcriptase domain-containing protein n=1 Tax=Strongyloides venezuelensis TaxID=75913 RepID=A0A0K0FW64_STRVS